MILQILKTVGILLEVILVFNIIIIVHELGHFLAARWRGLVVEKFGIWFGKPIWKKKIGGVEYSLGCIPAGGFVSLPQLAPMEAIEGQVEGDRKEMPHVSALDKIIVAFAGPLFSFLLAIAFAFVVWGVGRPVGEGDANRVIGYLDPTSPAYAAGLRAGDQINMVDGHKVQRFGGMHESVVWHVVSSEGDTIPMEVNRDGETLSFDVAPIQEKGQFGKRKPLRRIGAAPMHTPMIAKVEPDSAAAKAGLEPNDLVVGVNGEKVLSPMMLEELTTDPEAEEVTWTIERGDETFDVKMPASEVVVSEVFEGGPAAEAGLKEGDLLLTLNGNPIHSVAEVSRMIQADKHGTFELEVLRDGQKQTLTMEPAWEVNSGKAVFGFSGGANLNELGILWDQYGRLNIVHPSPMEQIRGASMTIVNMLGALFSPKSDIKPEHLSGPVGIMRMYYLLFDSPYGWQQVLWFSVILNVNLALLNLLPIPVLDGGHITLAIIEAIRRKPVNFRVLELIQTGCALLLIGFMLFVTFFDVQDLPIPGMDRPPAMKFVPVPNESAS